ncbi:MAG: gluconate 2-dehydrogenase subunit 3 family protein [Phycisphaerae bacterium]|nr:gluconate 2-dehydrogenase subunit 3 family protein [Gemmatimonadaceae bacterium]
MTRTPNSKMSSRKSKPTGPTTMNSPNNGTSRRSFLLTAGTLAAGSLAACEAKSVDSTGTAQSTGTTGFDRVGLDALSDCVLPEELGIEGRRAATAAFVAWADGYDPVAEEMHGYGYAEIRYLPPDPAPAWRAQLAGLDILARRSRKKPFAELDAAAQRELLSVVLRRERGDRLPAPLAASHIAVALLSHWASSAAAQDLAMGRAIMPLTCRTLSNMKAEPSSLPAPRT